MLENLVLEVIRDPADFVSRYEPIYLYMLAKNNALKNAEQQKLKHTMEKGQQRIEVHNNDKSSGHCYVKVDIYFAAVGTIGIPSEKEIQSMMKKVQKNP